MHTYTSTLLAERNTASIQNVPTRKTGLTFQNFRLAQEFSSGTSQKNVYHLHPNFQKFVVEGKQPKSVA